MFHIWQAAPSVEIALEWAAVSLNGFPGAGMRFGAPLVRGSQSDHKATFQPGDATVGPFSFPSACPASTKCSFPVLVDCLGPSWLVELGSANPSEWLAKAHFTLPLSTPCISFWSPQKETTCIKQLMLMDLVSSPRNCHCV